MKSACKSVQKAEHRIGQQKMMDQQRRERRAEQKAEVREQPIMTDRFSLVSRHREAVAGV